MGDYLLRTWGRDVERVAQAHTPDAVETGGGVLCYWFPSRAARTAFYQALPPGFMLASANVDAGLDDDGEIIDPHKETIARVTLRLPDGREGTYDQSFGYGYPEHGVRYMYEDGNYSCDCNRRTFLEHHCDIVDDAATEMCGDRIELVSLEIL